MPVKKKMDTLEFIKQATAIHQDKYDYALTIFSGWKVNVVIRCKQHGKFRIRPNSHIRNNAGCPKCRAKPYEHYMIGVRD